MEKADDSRRRTIGYCAALVYKHSTSRAKPKFNFWFNKPIRNVLAFTLYLGINYDVVFQYCCCSDAVLHTSNNALLRLTVIINNIFHISCAVIMICVHVSICVWVSVSLIVNYIMRVWRCIDLNFNLSYR